MTFKVDNSFQSRLRQLIERQLRRLPLRRSLLEQAHEKARSAFASEVPQISSPWDAIRKALLEHGATQEDWSTLGVDISPTLEAADKHVEILKNTESNGQSMMLASDTDLLMDAQPYIFGLSEPLLDFAESYLGLPVNYLGANIKREIPTGRQDSVGRRWHIDPEDERMIKFIIYLNNVDIETGPFEAMLRGDTVNTVRNLNYLWNTDVDAETFKNAAGECLWKSFTGNRLTANIVDPAGCFHRAQPPQKHDRFSITFSYLSQEAYFVFADGVELQEKFLQKWGHLLSERQRRAIGIQPKSVLSA